MIDVPPPPPTPDLTHGVGPYLLTLGVAGVGALWGMMRGKDAKLVGALEARIEEQKKQYEQLKESSQATIDKLGDLLDEERDARIDDARRTAKLLLQSRGGDRERPTEWDEAPTGVRELLELVAPGAIDKRREPASLRPPRRPRPR